MIFPIKKNQKQTIDHSHIEID